MVGLGLLVDVGLLVVRVRFPAIGRRSSFPDPREDLESRSPNLEPYAPKGTL